MHTALRYPSAVSFPVFHRSFNHLASTSLISRVKNTRGSRAHMYMYVCVCVRERKRARTVRMALRLERNGHLPAHA